MASDDSDFIPILGLKTAIDQLDTESAERINHLVEFFQNKFNKRPKFLVKVPGNVNHFAHTD